MDRRGFFGVLAGVLLFSVAVGVRDAAAMGGIRILMAEKEGKDLKPEEEAGPQSSRDKPVEGGGSSPNSETQAQKQSPAGHGNLPPSGTTPNSPPPSQVPSNPPAKPDKAGPLTPGSGGSSNPEPASDRLPFPVSDGPSHPPPAPMRPVNPPPSPGNPSNQPPPPPPRGSPSHPSPTSTGHLTPPPVSDNHPAPTDRKDPNPVPTEHGKESPPSGKDGKEKDKRKQTGSSSGSDDSKGKGQENDKCNGSMPIQCHTASLSACLQQPMNEIQQWFLLVQNEGENPINVNVSAPTFLKIDKTLSIPKHKRRKVGFHVDAVQSLHIVLNAGNGDCVLQMLPPSPSAFPQNIFQQLPNYANLVTPIYGVYLASLTVIFAGGAWACCKLRKRRRRVDGGVAYQQLEMGTQHQSSAVIDENEINGWDESWDDDWDEEEAVPRPPAKRGSASENGVAVRSSNKNEWEDWDD